MPIVFYTFAPDKKINLKNYYTMKHLKKLLIDVYKVAIIDGTFSNEEMMILNNLCFQNKVSLDELTKITKSDIHNEYIDFENEDKKRQYLSEIAKVIIADGKIRQEEVYLFNKIVKSINFDSDLDSLKEKIFKNTIDDFIKTKEAELKALKTKLYEEYELIIKQNNKHSK
jgi:tellurite resistance protein